MEILNSNNAELEATTRKLKHHCFNDLSVAAVSGTMRSSGLLRSVLISAALLLRTDIQELEGLNSMIKSQVLRANTTSISLELLCARVCLRKTIATLTGGSTKFKHVIPIASGLARSIYLFWNDRSDVLVNTERWSVSPDEPIQNGHFKHWNPGLLPGQSIRATYSQHKTIIQTIKSFVASTKGGTPCLVFQHGRDCIDTKFFVLGELSRSVGLLIELESYKTGDGDGDDRKVSGCNGGIEISFDAAECENPCDMVRMYCQHTKYFRVARKSSPMVSNQVVAAIFDKVTKDNNCSVFLLEMVQADMAVDGFCWTLVNINEPIIASVCVLQPRQRKPRSRKPKTSTPLHDDMTLGDLGDTMALEWSSDDSDHDTDEDHDDDEDDLEFALGLEVAALESSIDDNDDDIIDAQESNERIAAVASNEFAERHRNNTGLTKVDELLDKSHVGINPEDSVLDDHNVEQEAWLKDILLSRKYQEFTSEGPENEQDPDEDGDHCNVSSSSGPVGVPRFDQVHDGVTLWRSALQLSSESLLDKRTALQTRSVGDDKELSLMIRIACDGAMTLPFVQWTNTYSMTGREIRLDERNGIVCPIHWMNVPISFDKFEVVHPAIGECVRKVRKAERPIVSDKIIRLQKMYNQCLSASSSVPEDIELGGTRGCDTECCICGTSEPVVVQCGCCLLHAHVSCTSKVHDLVKSSAALSHHSLCLNDIPRIFVADCCPSLPSIATYIRGQCPKKMK